MPKVKVLVTSAFRRGASSAAYKEGFNCKKCGIWSPVPFGVELLQLQPAWIPQHRRTAAVTSAFRRGASSAEDVEVFKVTEMTVIVTSAFRRGASSAEDTLLRISKEATLRHQCLSAWSFFSWGESEISRV